MNAITKAGTITERAIAILEPIKADLPFVLPANVTPEHFKVVFTTAVMQNPDILKATPESLRRELLKCAQDGLLPDNRQATFVVYDGQVKYMPMVQGIISRARELGDLVSITAECVHERDEFFAERSDPRSTRHTTPPLDQDRGGIIGAYAIFRDKAGEVLHREILERKDLEKIRSKSRARKGAVWNEWEGEMSRKSSIRRGSKYVPMSPALRAIVNRDDELTNLTSLPRAVSNPLLPPVEQEGPAPLQERLSEAVALCTSLDELRHVEESFDAEIAEAQDADKEAARLLFNAKGKQIAALAEAQEARRSEDEAYAKQVTDNLSAKKTMAELADYANAEKAKVAALPADLGDKIYALYKELRAKLEPRK